MTFLVGLPRDSNALQEAVVGTSVVTVTGDFGSSMCQSDTNEPTIW